ncbi:3-phosphoshikimate 1-carboxyvinyltransferase [Sulfolobus sp. E3]|nr:3-phosphoshikimate 1-carboxyvinyltransferase [Sulfolobus sp. E3]
MIAKIYPSKITGTIKAPQSKSIAIRLIFLSLFTKVKLKDLVLSEDVSDAINAVKALGVNVNNDFEFIPPKSLEIKEKYIKLKGSATTLRMLIPIISAVGGEVIIDADEPLRRRPIKRVVETLGNYGVKFSSESLPVKMSGKLNSDYIKIHGDESSQYISGLIYALHILNGGKIEVIPPFSSRSYVYLTADIFNKQGSRVNIKDNIITIETLRLEEYDGEVGGDYGLSAFYALTSLVTGGELTIYNLWKPGNYFGDHNIVQIFSKMGAYSIYDEGKWYLRAEHKYSPIRLDIDDIPDLAMPISGLAGIAYGISELYNIKRLRIKESDRVNSIKDILNSYSIEVNVEDNTLSIVGKGIDAVRSINITKCYNDHRVAMLSSVLGLISGGTVEEAECVNKSNPNYWKDLISLGAKISIS